MKRGSVIVVSSPDDDFGATGRVVKGRLIGATYRYRHSNVLWRLFSGFLYYVVAPIPAWLVARYYGLRIHNRRAIRESGGCYLYGNHTHWVDAILPYILAFPRRMRVVTGPTAVSVPVVRHLVALMGGVPLNTTVAGKTEFRAALTEAVRRGEAVAIFPEAHEWPYYNRIREFSPASFTYPVHDGSPVVGYVLTYRSRRWLKFRAPALTVTVAPPIRPEVWAGAADPKQVVRDLVHKFMCETVESEHSIEWVHYQQ